MSKDSELSRRNVLELTGGVLVAGGLTGVASADETVTVIVGFANADGRRTVESKAETVRRRFKFGAMSVELPAAAARQLQRNPNIRYVEENSTYHALGQTLPWGVDRVDGDVLHDNGETGAGAHIAIIDSGIDADHEDLEANLGAGKAFTECSGSDCTEPWDDDNDHGTHCAGTADAIDNDVGVVGVATEATLHAVKVLESDGRGTLEDVAAGIEYVADQGWDVASLSLGASSGDQTLQDACEYAYQKGVLLVAAAGNDGPCTECVGYPAAYETVMAVASTDEDDSLSSFSSTGSEIELAAPGGSIYSTVVDGYATFSGTSMACPHVSGAGGHLMANGYTNTEARQRLQDTAEDIGLGENEQGHGLLDALTAVQSGFLVLTDGATNVTETTATLNGSAPDLDGADSAEVHFEYRQVGADTWTSTTVQTLEKAGTFSDDLADLTTGTEYEYRAVGEASDGQTDTGGIQTFTPSECVDASNWPAGSGSSGAEHITRVALDGQVVETSSDAAYYDFTCPDVVSVEAGSSFDLAFDFDDSGFSGHYANVFVDWGQQRDWSTAVETEIMEDVDDDSPTYTTTIDVPADAATGGTLARVRLSYLEFDDADDLEQWGEVNDFTIYVEDGEDDEEDGEEDDEEEDDGGDITVSVSTQEATEVDTTSATLNGTLEDFDGVDSVEVYFEWGSDGVLSRVTDGQTLETTGSFSAVLTDLMENTDYAFRAVAEAGDETDTGSTLSFATESEDDDEDDDDDDEDDDDDDEDEETEEPPEIETHDVYNDNSNNPHAEVRADWSVSDVDGQLNAVVTDVYQSSGDLVGSDSSTVSGENASGTHGVDDKHGQGGTFEVVTTVTDTSGNETTVSETLDT